MFHSAALKLLRESELNLHIFSGLVRRRHKRPFANSFLRGVRENLASGHGLGVSDFPCRVDDGLDDDGAFDLQMPGEVRVKGRYAGLDGADACGIRVQGEGGEEGKGSDPEKARCRALDATDSGTKWADEHWFFPWRKVRMLGSSAARDGFLGEFGGSDYERNSGGLTRDAGLGTRGEGEVLGGGAMLVAPGFEEAAVAQGDVLSRVDAEESGDAVDPGG